MMGRTGARLYFACIVAAVLLGSISLRAEERPTTTAADAEAPILGTSVLPAPAPLAPNAAPTAVDLIPSGISGNLAGINIVTGSGLLGRTLGFAPDSGVRIGGVWVGNANFLLTGGEKTAQSTFNSLLVMDLNLDLARLANLPGAQFGAQFLQFNGQPSNGEAGVVTGYNGLPGPPPLVRSELYQLWWRQSLFDEKLVVRIGKSVPTYDFNNVGRPVHTRDASLMIPSVTGLIYTPAFVNTTLLGVLPGYYNSAYGITTTLAPTPKYRLAISAREWLTPNWKNPETPLESTPGCRVHSRCDPKA